MRHSVIMDCDTGRDDAIAIALALASPDEIDLLGITAVAGNIALAKTARNALFICEICGRKDIKIYAGADRPLMRALETAEDSHGVSGLQGLEVHEPTTRPQPQHAVDFIIETLQSAPDESITLVPTGPLTNIALVIMKAPQLLHKIKQIVLMGGASATGGNMSPVAEFNIYVDPHAAKIVFNCGRPVVAFGLDVTYCVLADSTHHEKLLTSGRRAARTLAPLLSPMPGHSGVRHGTGRIPMHDPCTIAWLIEPELFDTKYVNVDVETASELTMGQTVVDFWSLSQRLPNTHWAYGVRGDRLLDMIVDRISRIQ